jgi:hypothetical protein
LAPAVAAAFDQSDAIWMRFGGFLERLAERDLAQRQIAKSRPVGRIEPARSVALGLGDCHPRPPSNCYKSGRNSN